MGVVIKMSISDIKSYSIENLYSYLLPIINNIYKDYKFINLDINNYKKMVIKLLKEIVSTYSSDTDCEFEIHFKNKLNSLMNNYVEKEMHSDKIGEIVNNFSNNYLNDVFNSEEAINELKKLETFLKKYNCILNDNICYKILSDNYKISKILKIITSQNKNNIFEDTNINLFIKNYLLISNEKIDENDDDSLNDDSKYDDNTNLYLREIPKELLSQEKERELLSKAINGDKRARDELVEKNLLLVVSIARKYMGRGLDFDDLIQFGNLGLIKAIEKFDLSKNTRFSTYAVPWIKQKITRGISCDSRNIRIPTGVYNEMVKYKRTQEKLIINLGRMPTEQAMAENLNISIEKVIELKKILNDTISLNNYYQADNSNDTLEFIIEDKSFSEDTLVDKLVLSSDIKRKFKEIFSGNLLTKNEKISLILYFGLYGYKEHSLEAIGKKINVTRERVRQICARAIKKIRNSNGGMELKQYISVSDELIDRHIRNNYIHRKN